MEFIAELKQMNQECTEEQSQGYSSSLLDVLGFDEIPDNLKKEVSEEEYLKLMGFDSGVKDQEETQEQSQEETQEVTDEATQDVIEETTEESHEENHEEKDVELFD